MQVIGQRYQSRELGGQAEDGWRSESWAAESREWLIRLEGVCLLQAHHNRYSGCRSSHLTRSASSLFCYGLLARLRESKECRDEVLVVYHIRRLLVPLSRRHHTC